MKSGWIKTMIPYISLFFISLSTIILALFKSNLYQLLYLVVFSLIAILMMLKYGTIDYFNYWDIYDGVVSFSELGLFVYPVNITTPVESGFALLILLEKNMLGSFFFFIAFFSILTISIKYLAIKKLSPFFLLSILIYLGDLAFWNDLERIRAGMASGLVMLSIIFIFHKKGIYFLITILIAMSFHLSALVALPFYFIRLISFKKFMFIALFTSFVIAYLGGIGLLIPELFLGINGEDTSRLVKYADSDYVNGRSLFGGTSIINFVCAFFFTLNYNLLVQKWNYNSILIPFYVFGVILSYLTFDFSLISGRILHMLSTPTIIAILPSYILIFKHNQRYVGYLIVIGYSTLWFFAYMISRPPYETILQFIF